MTEKDIMLRYEEQKKNIKLSTPIPVNENDVAKKKRVSELLGDFNKFCHYYFPTHFDKEIGGAEFGYFHLAAAKQIIDNKHILAILEWAREHAKSVFADIFIPLFLKARGEVMGMVIASQSGSKAKGLLSDIQAELESNQRYINDFGEQYNYGSWSEQHFVTRDGVGFWAIGRRESPRGLRESEKRPNLLIIDDVDDDEEVKNPDLVQKSLDWLRGALMGAMAILQSRIIMVGNRIGEGAILSHMVGDLKEGDPKNQGIYHSKVCLLENPKTHKEDQSETGVPAWKERYSRIDADRAIRRMGYRMAQREYFHRQVQNGTVFKSEWLIYDSIPPLHKYDAIATYNDPSFKDTKKNDFKAIVMVGRIANRWYIIDVWVRQATRNAMVVAHYDMHEFLQNSGALIFKHWIETNATQNVFIDDYEAESKVRKYMMPIHGDTRKKEEKKGRIEGLTVSFERGMIIINEKLRKSADFQNFKDQLLGFPSSHDDGPDALEGAIFKLREAYKRDSTPAKMGGLRRDNLRNF